MEANGFIFGDGEITHKDEAGKEWNVVRFNADGSAVIKWLNVKYAGTELKLSAEDAARISVESLNAGHNQIFVTKNTETGKVEKMFLPNVDKSGSTEAGWVVPIDIAQDPHNPTRVDSASAFHTRHVLNSALLGKGSEPWPENFPITKFVLESGGQFIQYWYDNPPYNGKFTEINLFPRSYDSQSMRGLPQGKGLEYYESQGKRVLPQGRSLGYIGLNTTGGELIVNMMQSKINDDGEGRVLNLGYGGEVVGMSNFYNYHLLKFRGTSLYAAIGDNLKIGRGGWERGPGVEELYTNDIDNQPWLMFEEELAWLKTLEGNNMKTEHPVQRLDITNSLDLEELQEMILYPDFAR